MDYGCTRKNKVHTSHLAVPPTSRPTVGITPAPGSSFLPELENLREVEEVRPGSRSGSLLPQLLGSEAPWGGGGRGGVVGELVGVPNQQRRWGRDPPKKGSVSKSGGGEHFYIITVRGLSKLNDAHFTLNRDTPEGFLKVGERGRSREG